MTLKNADRSTVALWVLPFILLVLFSGCSRPVELIEREVLFGHAKITNPRLSSDGQHIAYLAPVDGRMNLWIRTVGQEDDRPLTQFTDLDLNEYLWSYTSDHLLFFSFSSGNDNWLLSAVDIKTGNIRELIVRPEEKSHSIQTKIYAKSNRHPEELIIGLNLKNFERYDLYRLNTKTGELTFLKKGDPDIYFWQVDMDYNIRGKLVSEPEGGQSYWMYHPEQDSFTKEITWDIENDGSWPIHYDDDGRTVYMRESRGLNTTSLVKYDEITKESEVIYSDPDYDMEKIVLDPTNYKVQGVGLVKERFEYIIFDEKLKDTIYKLSSRRGNLWISNRSKDDQLWLLGYTHDDAATNFFLYHTETEELEKLFDCRDDFVGKQFARTVPISYTASDGLEIHGYMTKPIGIKGAAPMVLVAHEGPWRRYTWGYNPTAQWMANRGYVCLQVNYRGSTGYGKEFVNAGNLEFDGKMQQDLNDAVLWAIDNGVAERGKVAIIGKGYGGYAALNAALENPDLYSVAAANAPLLDLVHYLASIPPYWSAFTTSIEQRVGKLPRYSDGPNKGKFKKEKDWTAEDRELVEWLKERSPYYKDKEITIPVLLSQASHDFMSDEKLTHEYANMLDEGGTDIKFIEVDSEKYQGIEYRMEYLKQIESYLATHLGGRYQP